jgi:cold shock CspA family protein
MNEINSNLNGKDQNVIQEKAGTDNLSFKEKELHEYNKTYGEDRTFSDAERPENWIDYKLLPFCKSRVKFYDRERKFGFVTLLDDHDEPIIDAYLSGHVIEKAGIYKLEEGQILMVKHAPKTRGEAVVFVDRTSVNALASKLLSRSEARQ